ncbi:MAG TPA: hypothetical protein VFS34_08220 [Thermoanaerobaculia bacterium]|nr:hypothetical protein [Thermoanaerobaculia bacterium]
MKRFAAVAVIPLVLAACRKHETVTAGGSPVEIDRSGRNVTIRTADATATGGPSASLPAGFPKDVPTYPGAHVAAAVETGTHDAHAATFETNDWPDDVAKFYAGKLSRWKTTADLKSEDGHTLLLVAPDGRSLTLTAKREALNTIFTITVSPR